MDWVTGLITYSVLWWVCFFVALPFGIQRTQAPLAGTDTGAPHAPRLGRKAWIATLAALLVWVVVYMGAAYSGITFDALWQGDPDMR